LNAHLFEQFGGAILSGAVVTVKVTAGSLLVAVSISMTLSATLFLIKSRPVRACVRIYVEALRNVPSLTFLFLLYFGVASLGIRLSSLTAAVLGLGLIGGAVLIDILYSAFQAIPKGQSEAAASIGLGPFRAFRLIILPQALRMALPSVGNYAVSLIKDTSLVAAIAAPEIMFNARQLVNETFQTAIIYGGVALVYLVLTGLMAQSILVLEYRLEAR
jgi:His/Glu/Gln/Arg/opine family amino acid ABC transporter permease subunit